MDTVKTSSKSQTAADLVLTPTAMEINSKKSVTENTDEEVPKKPPIDLFKAIFEDDEDEEVSTKSDTKITTDNTKTTTSTIPINNTTTDSNIATKRKRASDWMT